MEGFLVILALGFFALPIIILVSLKSSMSSRLDSLSRKMDDLYRELKNIRAQNQEPRSAYQAASSIPELKPVKPEPKPEIKKEEIPEAKIQKPSVVQERIIITAPELKPTPTPPSHPPKPDFFERNPDLEKFIGENLVNKIGIAILVLGIGFFVKYAIDQNWINEIGRVFIGILCGGVLIGIAHYLRSSFKAFSSVLVGGGIAVLYFTIAIAFHEYAIFTQTAAFLLMVVITAFAVVLSLAYGRLELAVLSIIGGFASPFIVSTGEGNYVILFTYMLILNSGMLVLAYHKKWFVLNILAYGFTVIIVGGWLSSKFDSSDISMIVGALTFTTLFFFIFFLMNIINNVKERAVFKNLEIGLLLSNSFLYYAAGMIILKSPNALNNDFQGLFTSVLGIINFGFAFALFKNKRVDRNLVYLLIGLVLTFISLAAPIQLEGNYITLFWSAEAVLLLWFSQKSGIRLAKLASVIVTLLMTISLLMDWNQLYVEASAPYFAVILNKAYITSITSLLALIGLLMLSKKEQVEDPLVVTTYRNILTITTIILFYFAHLLELRYHTNLYTVNPGTTIVVGCYNMLFMLGLIITGRMIALPTTIKNNLSFIGVFAISSYLFYYFPFIIQARDHFLEGTSSSLGLVMHYIFIILLLLISAFSLNGIRKLENFNKQTFYIFWWFFSFFYVFIGSAELDNLVLLVVHSPENSIANILGHNHRIGFPILWGLASFILITIGFKSRIKQLRIISLTLFSITLLKLFLVDIRDISEGGKIAAFISLGIILLIVSFMYQRLKKILLDDTPENKSVESA